MKVVFFAFLFLFQNLGISLVTQNLAWGPRESALKSTTAGFANAPLLSQYEDVCDRRFEKTLTRSSSQILSHERYIAEEKPIIVLITSYNNKRWVQENVISALHQDYTRYRVIYIDDASTDGTPDRVDNLVKQDKKKIDFTLIRNSERKGALANIYYSIHNLCEDDAIIVSLDGDDWFYDDQVLKKVNAAYSEKEIWITHGTFIEYPSESTNWNKPIPRHIVIRNQFRTYRCASHLRTFYSWLFKKIRLEDLLYEGQFYSMTWDQAIMFPMMEMAAERHCFISSILYVYNVANPINDNKVDAQLQRDLEAFIRASPPYTRLNQECMK